MGTFFVVAMILGTVGLMLTVAACLWPAAQPAEPAAAQPAEPAAAQPAEPSAAQPVRPDQVPNVG
ncbi:TPA: hypothetical protein DEP86_00550 [Candidatus Uhrbacteria bacterium]|nr:hypothetical protein [Candidatus Uhrbacteria bacterium]